MKILLVKSWIHKKNRIAIDLLSTYWNAELTVTDDQSEYQKKWDLVFLPSSYLPPWAFPNAKKLLYGPHSFIHLKHPWATESKFDSRCSYNFLSQWVLDFVKEQGQLGLEPVLLPFPVDTERFQPSLQKQPSPFECFVYCKHRDIQLYLHIFQFLESKNINFCIFDYRRKYNEEDYFYILQSVNFGIWIGTHESQGFALQEALSCNIPLVVLEATSMFDERNEQNELTYKAEQGKYQMKATPCTYWDDRCGYKDPSLESTFQNIERMRESYQSFRPREFILEHLSPEQCAKRFQSVLGLEG
jgi:hypothetical protein